MYRFVCVLDFEASCDDKNLEFQNEIIEFPSVLLQYTEGNDLVEISRFQEYIAPVKNPKLTKFCTELTGITQETVDAGKTFKETLKLYDQWLNLQLQTFPTVENVLFVTCGDWDLRKMIALQCNISGVEIPKYFNRWCNLKILMSKFVGVEMRGMTCMLDHFKLKLLGRHHSGIDDCVNIAQVAIELFRKGCYLCPTTERIGKKVNSCTLEFETKNFNPTKIVTNKTQIKISDNGTSNYLQFHSLDKPCELILFTGKTLKELVVSIEKVYKPTQGKNKKFSLFNHGKILDSDSQISRFGKEPVIYQDHSSCCL
jgi:ERI1 exoribonuclease 3